MKRLIILTALFLLSASAYAGMGVGAAGISYDRVAGNPGFHLMVGSHFMVDSNASIWPIKWFKPDRIEGRLLASKYNYGKIDLDQMQFGAIGYYDNFRKYWDIQFGIHVSGTYERADGHFGFITGGEIRKDFTDKFGIFLAGDILFTDERPYDLFFITLGIMAEVEL